MNTIRSFNDRFVAPAFFFVIALPLVMCTVTLSAGIIRDNTSTHMIPQAEANFYSNFLRDLNYILKP